MQASIINHKTTLSDCRLDAEFYQPKYIHSITTLNHIRYEPLNRLASISDGNHLKIAENFLDEPGVRYLRGQDISSDMIISDRNIVYIGDELFSPLKRSHIKHNDILVTIVGANTGLVGLVYNPPKKLVASCKLGIVRPQAIKSGCLYAFLTCKYGQYQILRAKRGGGQTGLILPDLRLLKIPHFSRDVEAFIDEVVVNSHKLREEIKKSFFETQQYLLKQIELLNWQPKHKLSFVRSFSEGQQSERIDAEYFQPKYDEIVKAIKKTKCFCLGDIVTIKKCIEPGSNEYKEDGIKFVRVSNLSKFGIDDNNQQYVSEQYYQENKKHQPQKGEILLSKDATPGIAFHLSDTPEKMIPSGGVLRLKVNDEKAILPEYLTLVLNSIVVQEQIERDSGGSIIKHWLVDQVKNCLIPILDYQKQKEMKEKIAQSFDCRKKSKQLLEIAKQAVEVAIEKDEKTAMNWIDSSLNSLDD